MNFMTRLVGLKFPRGKFIKCCLFFKSIFRIVFFLTQVENAFTVSALNINVMKACDCDGVAAFVLSPPLWC